MNVRLIKSLATATVLGLSMSACVVVPARHTGYPGAGGVYAEAPPPAPHYEVVPAAPVLGAIWIAGFWNWHSGRHVWVPGRWSHPQHHHRGHRR